MLLTYQYLENIEKTAEQLIKEVRLLREYYDDFDCDMERFVRVGKRGARISSGLYLAYRGLLLSLSRYIPEHPEIKTIHNEECEMMDVSVEQLEEFDFPVYKISLPILLPNIRRPHADFNNAVTVSVKEAVKRFCYEHSFRPFDRATMIILTYGGYPGMMVDNDNKEMSVVQNGMIPYFLSDDTPDSCNNVYYFKRVGSNKEYRTEIYIVDSDHDLEVMKMVKSI